jgi:hypothetical protein
MRKECHGKYREGNRIRGREMKQELTGKQKRRTGSGKGIDHITQFCII